MSATDPRAWVRDLTGPELLRGLLDAERLAAAGPVPPVVLMTIDALKRETLERLLEHDDRRQPPRRPLGEIDLRGVEERATAAGPGGDAIEV
jgi:hypothetical protein